MNIPDSEFFKGFVRMANDGWEQGWHERNGGNLSYRIKPEEIEAVKEELIPEEWVEIGAEVPGVANEFFLITGSGKYFRNIKLDPENNIGIIEVDESGKKYRKVWGLKDSIPTSELPSHLMNHSVRKEVTDDSNRVVYHAHPANAIALTFVLPLKSEIFTRELWEMATECPVVFPEGIGVVDWMVPGGQEIAVATSKLMNDHRAAVWAHHGLFATGNDFDETFGLMHTIEKAAEILVKVRSMAPEKKQTITPEEFRELAKAFNVELPEKFLY